MRTMSEEDYIIETWEDEPSIAACKHCGRELEWVDCDACGGEGEYDCYDEDPLWYSPGDTEDCAQCGGDGGWWWCDNGECEGKK